MRNNKSSGNVIIMLLFFLITIVLTASVIFYLILDKQKKEQSKQVTSDKTDYLEYTSLLEELKEKREVLIEKETVLGKQAKRIKELEEELRQTRKTLESLQLSTSDSIVKMEEDEKKNLKKLSKMYGLMEPQQASKILAGMDDEIIVNILMGMKERQAAKLLGSFASQNDTLKKRAAQISKKMRTISWNSQAN